MTPQTGSITVTIPNPTAEQIAALTEILGTATATKSKRGRPAKTVSDEEDEEFATKGAVEEEELNDEAEESSDEEDAEETDAEEDDGEEDALSFDDVKAALNKYGNKNPEGAKALLKSFGVGSTKELEKKKSKWEPVYRKVQAKIKAAKKSK